MKRALAILLVLCSIMTGAPASSHVRHGGNNGHGGGGGGGGSGSNILARLYPNYPQANSYFPQLAFFVLASATDNVTCIPDITVASPTATCPTIGTGTLATYPTIASLNNPAAGTCGGANPVTSYAAAGGEISGARNMGANGIIVMTGSANWPEGIGCDKGELAIAQQQGLYLMAGGPEIRDGSGFPQAHTNFSFNTGVANSIASFETIANLDFADGDGTKPVAVVTPGIGNTTNTLIGYEGYDEPHCIKTANLAVNASPYMMDAVAGYHNLAFWDATRPIYQNSTGGTWLNTAGVYGSGPRAAEGVLFPTGVTLADGTIQPDWTNPSALSTGAWCLYNAGSGGALGSPPVAIKSLQASSIASADNYTMVSPFIFGQNFLYDAVSDFCCYPDDLIFRQALTVWNMAQYTTQPIWMAIEGANNAKASQQNAPQVFNVYANVTPTNPSIVYNNNGCHQGLCASGFGPPSLSNCVVGNNPLCSVWMNIGVTDAVVNFNGTISGTTLTVNSLITSPFNPVVVGSAITNASNSALLGTVTGFLSGSGGAGTYTLDTPQTIGPITMGNTANCLGTGTTIVGVTGTAPATNATLSAPPTCGGTDYTLRIVSNPEGTGIGYNGAGGALNQTGCRYISGSENFNICAPSGIRFRTSAQDVLSEAFAMIIAGARGFTWFPQDDYSSGWSYGGNDHVRQPSVYAASQAAADISVSAVQYVSGIINSYASAINATVIGQVTLETMTQNTSKDCIYGIVTSGCSGLTNSNGVLTLTSGDPTFPAEALVTQGTATFTRPPIYLFAEPLRCSDAHCSGAGYNHTAGNILPLNFVLTATGIASRTGRVIYDSNAKFDPPNSTLGNTVCSPGGPTCASFSDTLGDNGDNYQVKIYEFQ